MGAFNNGRNARRNVEVLSRGLKCRIFHEGRFLQARSCTELVASLLHSGGSSVTEREVDESGNTKELGQP